MQGARIAPIVLYLRRITQGLVAATKQRMERLCRVSTRQNHSPGRANRAAHIHHTEQPGA